mmetsp:Transcript_33982/g.94066  ORF Transcript_33982/g.94066 Transcript_33982/m.94066 type:complete len:311 (-) Transcript_33982:218-1150(-)
MLSNSDPISSSVMLASPLLKRADSSSGSNRPSPFASSERNCSFTTTAAKPPTTFATGALAAAGGALVAAAGRPRDATGALVAASAGARAHAAGGVGEAERPSGPELRGIVRRVGDAPPPRATGLRLPSPRAGGGDGLPRRGGPLDWLPHGGRGSDLAARHASRHCELSFRQLLLSGSGFGLFMCFAVPTTVPPAPPSTYSRCVRNFLRGFLPANLSQIAWCLPMRSMVNFRPQTWHAMRQSSSSANSGMPSMPLPPPATARPSPACGMPREWLSSRRDRAALAPVGLAPAALAAGHLRTCESISSNGMPA